MDKITLNLGGAVKKLLVVAVVLSLVLLPAMVQSQEKEGSWFFQGQGGVFSKYSVLKEGHVYGMASMNFMKMVLGKKLAVRGNYQDVEGAGEDWNDYTGEVVFFTRDPNLHKFQMYLLVGAGMAHSPSGEESDFAESSFSGGFGLIIPIRGLDFLLEGKAKRLDTDWIGQLTTGMQVGLDF
ncbi:hypothetical protein [Candidatus Magnetobacterium casense]|uniref:Outer membrane protein beta-barrel domain-containing protein n=1 Tax=Candidatus Magnetobacterium casense TaxID=1455061 RepID=A0ABS6RYG8_9BACT|nr:hypothetical protein [Candidatus Magnetobacterium casensis]MBV6341079.1 hypothetical protein [Candidatus Magnetobacterium casensis]